MGFGAQRRSGQLEFARKSAFRFNSLTRSEFKIEGQIEGRSKHHAGAGYRTSWLHRNRHGPMLLKHGHEVIGFDCNFYERCTSRREVSSPIG